MLTTLIESKRTRSRNRGAAAFSVIVHAIVIVLLAAVTAHASDKTPTSQPKVRDVIYVETPQQAQSEEQPSTPARPDLPALPEIPDLVEPTVEVPTTIPTDIPPTNPSLPPIDLDHFVIGSKPNTSNGGTSGSTSRGGSGTYTAWQVEKAVVALERNPKPVYPSVLQSANVNGEVLAQFVVDTTGHVDMSTFRALRATDELFVQSVRRALAKWQFLPAEVGGTKVRQLVQMPLTFRMK